MSITLQDDDDQIFDEDASSWAESIMLPIARNGPWPPHDIQLCTDDLQHQQQHGSYGDSTRRSRSAFPYQYHTKMPS
jgi:hypothetical protein